jgi:hypothetical protein
MIETTDVTLSGPFFTRDPGKTVRANVRDLMDAVAEQGDRDVESVIDAHVSPSPFYVRGRTSSLSGRRWGTWARISPDTSGLSAQAAIRLMAILAGRHDGVGSDGQDRGTTLGIEKQWHPFRTAKSNVYRARALLTADLTKGLE